MKFAQQLRRKLVEVGVDPVVESHEAGGGCSVGGGGAGNAFAFEGGGESFGADAEGVTGHHGAVAGHQFVGGVVATVAFELVDHGVHSAHVADHRIFDLEELAAALRTPIGMQYPPGNGVPFLGHDAVVGCDGARFAAVDYSHV